MLVQTTMAAFVIAALTGSRACILGALAGLIAALIL
jgi:hypothetical protein